MCSTDLGRRLLLGALFFAAAGCGDSGTTTRSTSAVPAAAPAPDPVERGRYLVTAGACSDCHTPWAMGPTGPAPDATRLLSGHPETVTPAPPAGVPEGWMMIQSATGTAFLGPWGVSYAANLTPHETGLGVWNEDLFVQAMRRGKHMGVGRPILPPMPWPAYSQLSDEDLRAVWAYLQTVPPIENVVPEAVIVPPPGAPAG